MEEISMPLLSMTTPRVLELCREYECLRNDPLPTVFIASYPKSGTTWMQWIVYTLLTANKQATGSNLSELFTHISHFTPFYEIEKTWDFSQSPKGELNETIAQNHQKLGCHVFNTHLPYQWLPKNPEKIKYLYVMRNGKDAAVSFFHHLTNQSDADQYNSSDFSHFLEDFIHGRIVYGKWLFHLSYWLKAHQQQTIERKENPILLLQYEAMIQDLKPQLQRIIHFLGLSNITEQQLEEDILPKVSFSYMKQHLSQFAPISVPWKEGYQFIRKGTVGDNVNCFTEKDHELYQSVLIQDIQQLIAEEREEKGEVEKVQESSINDSKRTLVPDWLQPFESLIDL